MTPNALVCTRLVDMHVVHPDQIERPCSKCGKLVGVYPTGQRALERYPKMKIICAPCTAHVPYADIQAQSAGDISEILQEMRDSTPVGKA